MPVVTNWAGNQRCAPARLARPATEDELRALIKEATAAGKQVRVVGAHHSWSDAALSDDLLINLDRLGQVLEVDAARRRVTVQAGIRLFALNEALAEHGLALPNLGSVSQQSVAGALSAGTHGSGVEHPILASAIVAARLVVADGTVRFVDQAVTPELLAAVKVSLGALGVISQLTLQCVDAFTLKEVATPTPIAEAIGDLEAVARSGEFVKVWWLPHTPHAQVFRADRTQEPQRFSPLARWVDEAIVNRLLFALVLAVSARLSSLIPALNRLISKIYFKPRERVDRSDRILNVPMPPRHLEMEYAVPLERAAETLERLRALIDDRDLKVDFVLEVRFVAADDAWLSPAYGRETAYIGAYVGDGPHASPWLSGAEAIFDAAGGRPHWGKLFDLPAERIRERYPMMASFLKLRRELDPRGTFINAFITRILGVERDL